MSVYERQYHISVGRLNYYTDDAAEALRVYYGYMKPDDYNVMPEGGIYEGYAEDSWKGDYVYRKNIGEVLPSTLEYRIQRQKVQNMLEDIR